MDLTEQELRFLTALGLSIDDVLDARRLSSRARRRMAEEARKTLILGSPCEKAGHRLRTRSGHCAQCDTRKIAFQSRYSQIGYVYIAGSMLKKVIKVGTTESIAGRQSSLRKEGYAGCHDWTILAHVKVANCGRLEQRTLQLLDEYKNIESYLKDGKEQYAWEAFRCSFTVAKNALDDAMKGVPALEQEYIHPYYQHYEFV